MRGRGFGERERLFGIIGDVRALGVYVDRDIATARLSLVIGAILLLINFCAAFGNHTRVGWLMRYLSHNVEYNPFRASATHHPKAQCAQFFTRTPARCSRGSTSSQKYGTSSR